MNGSVSGPGIIQAVKQCRYRQLKLLLDFGQKLENKTDSSLIAALHIDDNRKRAKMFSFLLRRGADCCFIDNRTGRSVLIWTSFLKKTQQLKQLVERAEPDLNFLLKDKNGKTALHYAAIRDNPEACSILCESMTSFGLSLDTADSDGVSPYLHAKRLKLNGVMNVLERFGACPTQFDVQKMFSSERLPEIRTTSNTSNGCRNDSLLRMLGKLSEQKTTSYRAAARLAEEEDEESESDVSKKVTSKSAFMLVFSMAKMKGKMNKARQKSKARKRTDRMPSPLEDSSRNQ
ncbi:unnamed protein product [Dimorphilus gyrociliatus]|uniref:Uncharacterized protein n=1 Tax=Dimorphilus gyrociliatus TaxID=2664684 RepID=A0A7I8VNQ4_9ANNE|nr:unnamed protein product [Dimorphilus gyrociliatus]